MKYTWLTYAYNIKHKAGCQYAGQRLARHCCAACPLAAGLVGHDDLSTPASYELGSGWPDAAVLPGRVPAVGVVGLDGSAMPQRASSRAATSLQDMAAKPRQQDEEGHMHHAFAVQWCL